MVADNVNGLFEMTGGIFVALHVLRLYHDKKVRGVSTVAVAFFAVWGWWNIAVYYPSLGQWWSTLGASGVAIANTVWLYLVIYYTRKEKRRG